MAEAHLSSFEYLPGDDVCYRMLDGFGFPGYMVGDDGTVWSLRAGSWRRLKPAANTDGHLFVTIGRGPARRLRYIHRLVLEAFVGPRPEGMMARHFPDRDPSNNRLHNLRWGTAKANQGDRVVHGTHCRGERCHAAKLTPELVRQIRAEYAAGGITQRALARKHGVHQGPVNRLLLRKSWTDVA